MGETFLNTMKLTFSLIRIIKHNSQSYDSLLFLSKQEALEYAYPQIVTHQLVTVSDVSHLVVIQTVYHIIFKGISVI